MTYKKSGLFFIFILSFFLCAAAMAQNNFSRLTNNPSNQHAVEHEHHNVQPQTNYQRIAPQHIEQHAQRANFRIAEHDRALIHRYYAPRRDVHCVSGFRGRRISCVPVAPVTYVVGNYLPEDVRYYDVPQPLVTQLAPAPAGYSYVSTGQDILLVSNQDRLIIDIVSLLDDTSY
jgi:Ni/Co efflux regulator RcnB